MHQYPIIYNYTTIDDNKKQRVLMVEYSKTRSKHEILRIRPCWDWGFLTVIDLHKEQDYKDFLNKTTYEAKSSPNSYKYTKVCMGGLDGYTDNNFYWNMIYYAFVKAITDFHILEDEYNSLSIEQQNELINLPRPIEIVGIPRLEREIDNKEYVLELGKNDYKYPYLEKLEDVCTSFNLKLNASF